MTNALRLAGLCLVFASPVLADASACQSECKTQYQLTSASDTRRYGILIAAPEAGCRHVRFRVADERAVPLGQTPTLAPGELAVVRIGRGFTQGVHLLTIDTLGCDAGPAATRRVTLAKRSPDHGWRSSSD
ncbi:MAG: hypothetical protein ACKO2N_16355 [Tabrizicola sp.]